MRVLILGGTKFVGRAIVTEALAAGHEVTITNRGTQNSHCTTTTAIQCCHPLRATAIEPNRGRCQQCRHTRDFAG